MNSALEGRGIKRAYVVGLYSWRDASSRKRQGEASYAVATVKNHTSKIVEIL